MYCDLKGAALDRKKYISYEIFHTSGTTFWITIFKKKILNYPHFMMITISWRGRANREPILGVTIIQFTIPGELAVSLQGRWLESRLKLYSLPVVEVVQAMFYNRIFRASISQRCRCQRCSFSFVPASLPPVWQAKLTEGEKNWLSIARFKWKGFFRLLPLLYFSKFFKNISSINF